MPATDLSVVLKQFGLDQDSVTRSIKHFVQLYGRNTAHNGIMVNYTELCDAINAGPFFI